MQYIVSGGNEDNGEFMTEPYFSEEPAMEYALVKQREGYDVMVQELRNTDAGRQYRRIYSGGPIQRMPKDWHQEDHQGVSAADRYLEELDYE
jgi:hypothetical protein